MIIDWQLVYACGLFFVLSPLYAWGMLHLWGTDHRWSLAAPLGILCIHVGAYMFGFISYWTMVYIAAMFLAAYPGMLYHDLKYREMLKCERAFRDQLYDSLVAVLEASDNQDNPAIKVDTTKIKNWRAIHQAYQTVDQYQQFTSDKDVQWHLSRRQQLQ